MNSKRKGKAGELELASYLRARGVAARRGRQFNGRDGSPDVVSALANIHIECKRCEQLNLYAALDQASNDAWGKVPVVMHRRNGREWVAILKLGDLLALLNLSNNLSKGRETYPPPDLPTVAG
jgi:Holliday junction resolvase